MNKRILGGLLCAAMLCAAPALAMPGMGEGKAPVDKFPMMDANKDGSVSKEEFKKFFPQMQDGAFVFIKDGEVFHQIYRGNATNEQLYVKISDALTVLTTGGEEHE